MPASKPFPKVVISPAAAQAPLNYKIGLAGLTVGQTHIFAFAPDDGETHPPGQVRHSNDF